MTELSYSLLIPFIWIAWLSYWKLSAADTKTTRRHESAASRTRHILPLFLSFLIIAVPRFPGPEVLFEKVFSNSFVAYWTGIFLLIAGLLFTVWARVYLGRNWSGTVTLKEGHELIRTGPYAIVRHPIYTGLLLAIAGSAICRNEWRGLLAIVLALTGFIYKLRLEERWMIETFGDTYRDYRKRVRALIPFVL